MSASTPTVSSEIGGKGNRVSKEARVESSNIQLPKPSTTDKANNVIHTTHRSVNSANPNNESPSSQRPKSSEKTTTDVVTRKDSGSSDDEQQNGGADGDDDSEDDGQDDGQDEDDGDDDDDDNEEEEEEEPRLKYARVTQNMAGIYRNGDATSAFLVAGDKMIVGTHNGNIHVFQLPMFQPLRVYHAHSASVTAISISPFPPPLPNLMSDQLKKIVADSAARTSRPASRRSEVPPPTSPRKPREPTAVLNIPSNNIHIATASIDGNVCIQSLVDPRDVQLRNFARPVQTVALSPEYRQDRTYLSGGLAENLILTVGGQPGRSTSTTVGTAAAAASGWLGSMGLGTNTGKDTVLHTGEGAINTIKWSLSGKYAVWLNEHGIKIMRTKIQLESADAESAWKRIGHIDRPQTEAWDTMASVWKGRVEWIDENTLDNDEGPKPPELGAFHATKQQAGNADPIERLLVGWGSTIWIIHVHPGGVGVGKFAGERSVGRVDIIKILRMDCIISGIALYTDNQLLVLAYCMPEDTDSAESRESRSKGHKSQPSVASNRSEPTGGIHRRQNNQPPELRLIDLASQAEVDKDVLGVSRFERLSGGDYHLGVLPAQTAAAAVSSKGALEALADLGVDMWNAAINPKMLFSSGASMKSKSSNDGTSFSGAFANTVPGRSVMHQDVHPSLSKAGIKIFIHSPYDCILATRRDISDHLSWLLENEEYQRAWELVDERPDAVLANEACPERMPSTSEGGMTVQVQDNFFGDALLDALNKEANLPAEREKMRIGELWITEVVEAGDWAGAGRVAGKVLRTADRWEKWVWTFAGADKLDEITDYMPAEPLQPPIPRTIYEIVLGHYLKVDKPHFRALLDQWPTELFDISTVVTALENQLNYRDVREDSIDDGERGRDWRIVVESLARMHEANGRHREALRSYIKLQDADSAFRLIRANHLADAVVDDIPSFIALRVPAGQAGRMTAVELEESTAEAITLLVDEAQHGLVRPETVVSQLQERDLNLYTFFYLHGLWDGDGIREHQGESHDRLVSESRAQLDAFADLAVHLFALFDRPLLMEFLKSATSYSFEKAAVECEKYNYIDELVYLYSKTGQMKRALYLIIDRLGDVSRAIEFAKEQDDPDLWDDLLNYSMDKPQFIRGLLEEVGTAIDPITLVRRIPEALEIEGLRDGLRHIMKEHEIQHSISSGVARVLRSEVATAQTSLRRGQRRGIKFDMTQTVTLGSTAMGDSKATGDAEENDIGANAGKQALDPHRLATEHTVGRCAKCLTILTEGETDTLVGFACGHVFHLTHLLDLQPEEAALRGFGGLGDDALQSRRNVIGTKITHARLLRDSLRDGCPVCKAVAARP